MSAPHYPFVPKSSRLLRPGDYWAVPMGDARFACGRVIQTEGERLVSPARAFFGGLHDWVGNRKPTSSDLQARGFVAFGMMHVRAIVRTGGVVLGNRALDLDHIEPPLLLDAQGGPGTTILRGVCPVRLAHREEWGTLPTLGYWGYDFIQQLAFEKLASDA